MPCNEMWDDLDPNDPEEIDAARTGVVVEKTWKFMLKLYKESMRKWTSQTRGGRGDPDDCTDFESRDP